MFFKTKTKNHTHTKAALKIIKVHHMQSLCPFLGHRHRQSWIDGKAHCINPAERPGHRWELRDCWVTKDIVYTEEVI